MTQRRLPLTERRLIRANLLLRRVYDLIEMSHLTDMKLIPTYCQDVKFPRQLGDEVFNHLTSDPDFQAIVMKRQQRFRRRAKKRLNRMERQKKKNLTLPAGL